MQYETTHKADMDLKEKAGDFMLDIAKLVFGGVLLAGIMSEDINKYLLYTAGTAAFVACCMIAAFIFKSIKRKEE